MVEDFVFDTVADSVGSIILQDPGCLLKRGRHELPCSIQNDKELNYRIAAADYLQDVEVFSVFIIFKRFIFSRWCRFPLVLTV